MPSNATSSNFWPFRICKLPSLLVTSARPSPSQAMPQGWRTPSATVTARQACFAAGGSPLAASSAWAGKLKASMAAAIAVARTERKWDMVFS